MPLFLQHKESELQWGIWKVDEPVSTLLDMLPEGSNYEKDLEQFTAERRKQEWLSVRVLLLRLLGEEKQIVYDLNGKPSLKDNSYFISISHTKGYVALILSRFIPVGIDIEHYGQRVNNVVSRFMREDEKAFPYKGDMTWGLLLHWSAKETLFKCVKGADADLRKVRLECFMPMQKGGFRAQEYWTYNQQVLFVSYYMHPDFVLTWTILS